MVLIGRLVQEIRCRRMFWRYTGIMIQSLAHNEDCLSAYTTQTLTFTSTVRYLKKPTHSLYVV